MNFRAFGWVFLIFLSILTIGYNTSQAAGVIGPLEYNATIQQDTFPIQERFGDFITDDTYNPFDIQTSEVEQVVEYDYETGNYLIYEKIGDEYFRSPVYLTLEEYLEYTRKKQEREQFLNLSGVQLKKVTFDAAADPTSKFDLEGQLSDRLFGGVDVEIKPTGFVDLTMGYDYSLNENPRFTRAQQRGGSGFDFRPDINAGIDGNIGEKLNLDFDYNTLATFDFDNTLNFAYNSEDFDEDDIIKRIEAGNVSLPLRSNLIKGREDLFGLLTEAQWGKFRLTGVAAQVRTQQNGIKIENGNLISRFEVRPDEYDENRHFFISHYNRDNYEKSLSRLPQVKSLFRITNIEVWVTTDQNIDLQHATTVAAIADLGEGNVDNLTNENPRYQIRQGLTNLKDKDGQSLPDNRNTQLFEELVNDNTTRKIVNTATNLKGGRYQLTQTRDFEVQTMRKLSSSEFTFYPQLGFISLNQRLRPNQVLGVAYEYTYAFNGNEVYKVGEMSNESNSGGVSQESEPEPEDVIYVKMLKSTNQTVTRDGRRDTRTAPMWDLMMKNIYSLPTSQLTEEGFKFDIFYEDFCDNTFKRFIPEDGLRTKPLMNIFKLDQLNRQGDPQQDGEFDFIPGVTVNSRSGSIIFPVLEPFGQTLLEALDGNQELYDTYGFQTLYTGSLIDAQQNLDNNRFVMKGEFKGNATDEISLGTFNLPPGSVTVRAGSQILVEDVDYQVDYASGRLRILNDLYLQQGVPLDIDFEDKNLFSLQRQTMLGLRGDYQFNENFNMGFTYMRLFERPFTQKVNFGDDPINNRMFGLDMDFTTDAPFITRALDKLPLISTKEQSSISFTGEVAALKPGHAKAINVPGQQEAVVSLDDFEGAGSGLPLASAASNEWVLASTPLAPANLNRPSGPLEIPGAESANNLEYGANRALLNWFVVSDFNVRSAEDEENPYTERVGVRELFRTDLPQERLDDLRPFDLIYRPTERGPYNFDTPEGIPGISKGARFLPGEQRMELNEPETRWAGIMRALPNNDFQQANYQFIEFWMLNPFINIPESGLFHEEGEEGTIVFNLGNVSEDVMKDNLQYFENSNPVPGERIPPRETAWGRVPLSIPNVRGFNLDHLEIQDLGFDGMADFDEENKYSSYLEAHSISNERISNDPANDNYVSYLNDEVYDESVPFLDRFRKFNNPEANVPRPGLGNRLGNANPDSEDLNNNRSLEQNESYYRYEIKLKNVGGEIELSSVNGDVFGAGEVITDIIDSSKLAGPANQKWYRFRIPIAEGQSVNGIQGFRSIQFMRMYFKDFKSTKVFRLAEFELARNQWRATPSDCAGDIGAAQSLIIDDVGVFLNSDRKPFNYVLPKGIKQERLFNTFTTTFQDEQAMSLRLCELPDDCDVSVNRVLFRDLRQYKNLQLFVHAEDAPQPDGIIDSLSYGDLEVFLRVGKDFNNNYYEYSIPLTMSKEENLPLSADTGLPSPLQGNSEAYSEEVWRPENFFDIPLSIWTDLKTRRNQSPDLLKEIFSLPVTDFEGIDSLAEINNLDAKVSIKGNPSLGYTKTILVGLRNPRGGKGNGICANVWVNELRLQGLNEEGGVAGQARLDIQLADLGNISASTSYSSVGFGQLDDAVSNRSLARNLDYDVATNLELGKLFPQKWGLSVPFYYQYAKSVQREKFDQYELDLTEEQVLENPNLTEEEIDDIKDRNKVQTTIKTLNFTNVRKERSTARDERRKEKGKEPAKPMPWDISNFSASYGYTETEYSDYIVKSEKVTEHNGALDYGYAPGAKYIQPFKNLKSKPLRFIKELNFNPVPNSFTFNTDLRRLSGEKLYRVPDVSEGAEYFFNDQRFTWDRNYALNWDLTKSLKLTYNASANSIIDELRQVGIAETRDQRDWADQFGNTDRITYNEDGVITDRTPWTELVDANGNLPKEYRGERLNELGRMRNYNQGITLSYNLPFKYLPGLDWITARAQYDGDYTWTAGSQLLNNPLDAVEFPDDLESRLVGNVIQNNQRRALNTTFAFDKLYDKIPYLKSINSKPRRTSRSRRGAPRAANNDRVQRRKPAREATTFEKIFVRPLLSIREVKLNFSQDMSTVIPGFLETPRFLGVGTSIEPGYEFAFGLQPDLKETMARLSTSGFVSENPFLNQQVQQNKVTNIDAKIEIEPWNDFTIDVDFRKSFTDNQAFDYLFGNDFTTPLDSTDNAFLPRGVRTFGSYQTTYWALETLFGYDIESLFRQFEKNRFSISERLLRDNPDAFVNGPLSSGERLDLPHEKDGALFVNGYGRQNQDVLIPAFIAAYTNQDPDLVELDLTEQVRKNSFIPKPNWQLRYNGLNKLPWFKEIFSSVSISHGYTGQLEVNSFQEDLQYDQFYNPNYPLTDISNQANQNTGYIDPLISNRNYFSRYEIPAVVITERFVPVIGIDIKTVNDINMNFEFAKSRTLGLDLGVGQLNEVNTTELIFGFGWTLQNVNIPFLTGRRIKAPKFKASADTKDGVKIGDKEDPKEGERGVNTDQNKMNILFNFGLRDDVTYLHELDSGASSMPTRGLKSLTIAPSIDYDISENFNLRWFIDYNLTEPYVLGSYRSTRLNGGFTARFNLN